MCINGALPADAYCLFSKGQCDQRFPLMQDPRRVYRGPSSPPYICPWPPPPLASSKGGFAAPKFPEPLVIIYLSLGCRSRVRLYMAHVHQLLAQKRPAARDYYLPSYTFFLTPAKKVSRSFLSTRIQPFSSHILLVKKEKKNEILQKNFVICIFCMKLDIQILLRDFFIHERKKENSISHRFTS